MYTHKYPWEFFSVVVALWLKLLEFQKQHFHFKTASSPCFTTECATGYEQAYRIKHTYRRQTYKTLQIGKKLILYTIQPECGNAHRLYSQHNLFEFQAFNLPFRNSISMSPPPLPSLSLPPPQRITTTLSVAQVVNTIVLFI